MRDTFSSPYLKSPLSPSSQKLFNRIITDVTQSIIHSVGSERVIYTRNKFLFPVYFIPEVIVCRNDLHSKQSRISLVGA